MTQFILEFPYAPPPELRKNNHGANRWKIKEAKDVVRADAMRQLLDIPEGSYSDVKAVSVQYVSYFCGRPIDATEFATGMAPALDCLSPEKRTQRRGRWYVQPGIGMIEDDSPEFVLPLPTKYVKVPHRKDVKTLMLITRIDETFWEWDE